MIRLKIRKRPRRKGLNKKNSRWYWSGVRSSWFKIFLAIFTFSFVVISFVLIDTYIKFSRQIDKKISGEIFLNTAKIYGSPLLIYPGQTIDPLYIKNYLKRAGYSSKESEDNLLGFYNYSEERLEIFPGNDSYFSETPDVSVDFDQDNEKNEIKSIHSLATELPLESYHLEPHLITHLFDKTREKRRLIKYSEIPSILIQAVLAIEDRRFFSHYGFDPIALIRVAIGGFERGASTITQQLVRSSSFWLTRERRIIRKAKEIYMSAILETRLSKQDILTLYSNDIYLGQRGSFSINGFGEASTNYFDKDIRNINLPEAALLAGLIQSPNRYSPIKYPERAIKRRDTVLLSMLEVGNITEEQYQAATEAPLKVAAHSTDLNDAPYFVDMLKDKLLETYSEKELLTEKLKVYTTLDPDLQSFAFQAVRRGAEEVDELLFKRRQRKIKKKTDSSTNKNTIPLNDRVQVSLIALDPKNGEIKALVGGRDYGMSQLNRITHAKRQPGSIFKPFVFAAAINSAIEQTPPIITTSTLVDDVKTVFEFNEEPYEPNNYGEKFYGPITLRMALTKSLNVATVKFAEMIGWEKVVDLALSAGLNEKILATPAVALGAYEVTPLEMAGAFTIFANRGTMVEPQFIKQVVDRNDAILFESEVLANNVLDPRIAYMMTNLMSGVMNRGTGVRARRLGFQLPAAGKTGTSHDGWFSGYTQGLLCIVWVGFDDYRELNLEGAASALPIWTEFMKKATKLHPWLAEDEFEEPNEGMIRVHIDEETGLLAAPDCPSVIYEYYIPGTEPSQPCGFSAHEWLYDQREMRKDSQISPIWQSEVNEETRKKPTIFKKIFSKIF